MSEKHTIDWSVHPEIDKAVQKMIKQNPAKHQRSQDIGEYYVDRLMNEVEPLKDSFANSIIVQEVVKTAKLYGFDKDELSSIEKTALEEVWGKEWEVRLKKEL
jgi:hypothetical protein